MSSTESRHFKGFEGILTTKKMAVRWQKKDIEKERKGKENIEKETDSELNSASMGFSWDPRAEPMYSSFEANRLSVFFPLSFGAWKLSKLVFYLSSLVLKNRK